MHIRIVSLAVAAAIHVPAAADFPVGFRIYEIPDSTRRYEIDGRAGPRPLQLWVWYPAPTSDGTGMRLRDYLSEPGSRVPRGSAAAVAAYRERFSRGWDVTLDEAELATWLEGPVPAIADAPPAPGRHPAVLFEVGLNAPAYLYTSLAEGLAGRGFVVASIASFGHAGGARLTFDSAGVATQIADLEYALRSLQSLSFVDSARLATGGWSVGALSAMLLASRRAGTVDAFVSIDGASGYAYGVELAEGAGFSAGCFVTPFLHVTGTRPGRFRVVKSRAIYEALPGGDAYWGTVVGLNHGDFTSYGGIRSPLFAARPAPEREDVLEGTRQLERIVGAFLEHYTGDDTGGWNDLLRREPIEQLGDGGGDACPHG